MTPERAHEALSAARLLLDRGHVYDAINRMYYAGFYAVVALLLVDGLYSSKHAGVRALFNMHWIRTEKLPVEMGKLFQLLFDSRHDVDYGDFPSVTIEDARSMEKEATRFVSRIEEELAQLMK